MSATKHNSNAAAGSPYQVPPEPNRWPSIGLAVGVHALLLAFLVVGINWTNNQPVAVEAEVWDTSVQQAAPPAPQPPPQAEPEPEPDPKPVTPPPPTPRVVEPPPKAEPAPPKQPDIALEREKKRKEELKRQRIEEEQRIERERELAEQKREQEKKEKALADKKAREEEKKEKALADKKAREEEKKKEQELAKKEEEAEKKKKEKAEKLAKAAAEKAEAAKLDKLRAEEMKRLTAGAGNPGSSGTAEKSTAPRIDKGYIASIASKIKGNTTYPGSTDVPGNPEVVFQVEQLPTGEILSVRKTKSSGIPAFDEAVERGINKSSPLPKKKDGTVERSVQVGFKLKEMN